MSQYHTSVLLKPSVDALISDKSGIYIDATFGGGGHTAEILSRLNQSGRVIAFDRDEEALEQGPDDDRLTLIHSNFRFIYNHIRALGIEAVDGILADLGVSSHQFDTPGRGFSFRFDTPLDMRMGKASSLTAADIVNSYSEEDLARILRIWGEVDGAGKMAGLIVKAREVSPILTSGQLQETISKMLPSFAAHKTLAKVFQALRIEVNAEMRSLEKFLEGCTEALRSGGRLCVITYHSLEDRMVKNFIRSGNIDGEVAKDSFGNALTPFKPADKKSVTPSEEEISSNTRARSARLRIAQKI